MSEWQPIETLDHSLGVLVHRPQHSPVVAYRDATGVMRVVGSKNNYTKLSFVPTHWMPLPSPPEVERENQRLRG